MTPAAQRLSRGAGEWSQPGNTQPESNMKFIAIIAALFAATAIPAAAASTDDKPKVVAPVTVEPACAPGECSGK